MTCACVIEIPDNPYNERKAIQLEQCRTHDTASQCLAHNRSLSTNTETRRTNERKKPEFQRR